MVDLTAALTFLTFSLLLIAHEEITEYFIYHVANPACFVECEQRKEDKMRMLGTLPPDTGTERNSEPSKKHGAHNRREQSNAIGTQINTRSK